MSESIGGRGPSWRDQVRFQQRRQRPPEVDIPPEATMTDNEGPWVKRRIMPKRPGDIRRHPRVRVVGKDSAGFTLIEAQLLPSEGVCWRCGSIAEDPYHDLEVCPTCGGDFND